MLTHITRMVPHSIIIGSTLLFFALFFVLFAIVLMGDRPLLILANMCFFTGTTMVMGFINALKFFVYNMRCTIWFVCGITCIYLHLELIGVGLEAVGCIYLLFAFWSNIFSILYYVPIIGTFLYWIYPPKPWFSFSLV
jgi:hypothetical protein